MFEQLDEEENKAVNRFRERIKRIQSASTPKVIRLIRYRNPLTACR
jgi:hypothetical protein